MGKTGELAAANDLVASESESESATPHTRHRSALRTESGLVTGKTLVHKGHPEHRSCKVARRVTPKSGVRFPLREVNSWDWRMFLKGEADRFPHRVDVLHVTCVPLKRQLACSSATGATHALRKSGTSFPARCSLTIACVYTHKTLVKLHGAEPMQSHTLVR